MTDGYEPRWDLTYPVGQHGEWVADTSLRCDKVEVKNDKRAMSTGNLYVEYRCLKRGVWKLSGIAHPDHAADAWAFVLDDDPEHPVVLFIGTERLRQLCKTFKHRTATQPVGDHPTRGILVPVHAVTRLLVRKEVA